MNTWSLGYNKAKEKAKEIYGKIGRIESPALNGEYVAFTSKGFDHLMRKGRIPRTRNEQKRRFVLIQYAEQIIKNPKAKILFRQNETKRKVNRHGEIITLTSLASFWTFAEKINGCTIKVVIAQFRKDGQKEFMSIMGNRVEIARGTNKKPTKKPA